MSRLRRSYFYSELRLGNVLKMFLFFWQSEPQRSYKHGSYSKKSVYARPGLLQIIENKWRAELSNNCEVVFSTFKIWIENVAQKCSERCENLADFWDFQMTLVPPARLTAGLISFCLKIYSVSTDQGPRSTLAEREFA